MKPYELFAVVQPGLEPFALQELQALGLKSLEQSRGGIGFHGHYTTMFKVHAFARTISRVLVRRAEFHASSFWELERSAGKLPWAQWLDAGGFKLRVQSYKSRLYHEEAIAKRLSAVIELCVPGSHYQAHDVDDAQLLVVTLNRDVVRISQDASGLHLHKRGYLRYRAAAPLRETIAAAMLVAIGWNGETPLWDITCGSGTIPLEAATLAAHKPLHSFRSYQYQKWQDFPAQRYEQYKQSLEIIDTIAVPIVGSDIAAKNIAAARKNAQTAGISFIDWQQKNLFDIAASEMPTGTCILCNPPYGKRLGMSFPRFYGALASWKKQRPDLRIGFIMADEVLKKNPHLKPHFKVSNGGIATRFVELI